MIIPTSLPDTSAVSASVLRSRMTVADFNAHNRKPDAHLSLPDGTTLFLTASGMDMFERLTGSFIPQDFHEATIFLWCATCSAEYWLQMWEPAPPVDRDEDTPLLPVHRIAERLKEAVAWRDAFLPAGASIQIIALAMKLWNYVHETALEVDEAALPDTSGSAEKKSPAAPPTGSSPPSAPFPEEVPNDGPIFFTESATGISSPPTEPGSPAPALPPLPPPPDAAATP